MVGPSPSLALGLVLLAIDFWPYFVSELNGVDEKQKLRGRMRAARRNHVESLPQATRALVFLRPPRPIADLAPERTTVGLYHANPNEAPTRGYAKWFFENGRHVALPRFDRRGAPMRFHAWRDPYEDSDLELGPYGHLQPTNEAERAFPQLVFVPLVAFTAEGGRLGQGGGHYDRWLADNPPIIPVGLAWDSQLVDALPLEPHDRLLRAVVTPTRLYEGER